MSRKVARAGRSSRSSGTTCGPSMTHISGCCSCAAWPGQPTSRRTASTSSPWMGSRWNRKPDSSDADRLIVFRALFQPHCLRLDAQVLEDAIRELRDGELFGNPVGAGPQLRVQCIVGEEPIELPRQVG